MHAIFTVLAFALMLFNFFGGIVSGVWLAWLDQWWALGFGLLVLLTPFVMGIVLLPGIVLGAPVPLLLGQNRAWAAFPFLLLSQAYTYALIAAWCLFVFHFYLGRADAAGFWPTLVWSYTVALAPWMFMAQKEGSIGAVIPTISAQIGYLAIGVLAAVFGAASAATGLVFGAIMLAGAAFQIALAMTMLRGRAGAG